jgi:hypothetical protein
MNKKLNEAVAKLHLEPGDALVVDSRVFTSPEDMHFSQAPRDVRIFAVLPNPSETVHHAFCTLHAAEIDKLTKDKLFRVLRAFDHLGGHPAAIIDGLENDFCRCDELLNDKKGPCTIHERCAVLRTMMKEPANAAS